MPPWIYLWGPQLWEAVGEAVCCIQEVQHWGSFESLVLWNAYKSSSACKAAVHVPHNLTFALRWSSNEAKNLLGYVSAVMVDCVGVVSVYVPDQTKPQ